MRGPAHHQTIGSRHKNVPWPQFYEWILNFMILKLNFWKKKKFYWGCQNFGPRKLKQIWFLHSPNFVDVSAGEINVATQKSAFATCLRVYNSKFVNEKSFYYTFKIDFSKVETTNFSSFYCLKWRRDTKICNRDTFAGLNIEF